MNKKLLLLAGLFFSGSLLAFPCYITAVKDNCWTNYSVILVVKDALNNNVQTTVLIPKGQSWTRQAFNCNVGERLGYTATFEPSFWASEKNAVYNAQAYTLLPNDPPAADEKAWEVQLCFPTGFPGVPLPPEASGNCKCDMKAVPPIPPVK